jgi:hypothetical protein
VTVSADDIARTHQMFLARIEPVRVGLLSLIDDVDRAQQVNRHRPTAGSQAADEIAHEPAFSQSIGGRPVVTARQLGVVQLAAAADQLNAMCRLLALEETVLYADKVLARAGIEAAARGHWLLDPAISVERRIARGLSERLHDAHQADMLVGTDERLERQRQRLSLVERIRAAGFDCRTPNGRASFVDEPRPGATKVMQQLLDADLQDGTGLSLGTGMQRYLSTFVHATTLGLHSVMVSSEAVEVEPGVSSAPFVSNSADVARLIAFCSVAWTLVAAPYMSYMGWRDAAWDRSVLNHSVLVQQAL